MLGFLAPRAIEGTELVKDGQYLRTVKTKHGKGHIKAEFSESENCLTVSIYGAIEQDSDFISERLCCLFDLDCDPWAVNSALSSLESTRPGTVSPGARVPGCFEPFELSVRAVLGQQISVKAARTLAGRFTAAFGERIETGVEGLAYLFPEPGDIVLLPGEISDHLGPLGITSARARTILSLAKLFCENEEFFSLEPEQVITELVKLEGIGMWTAQYLAMRALHWRDAFPHTDLGIKKALAPLSPKEILALAENWRPMRAYAAINLWNSY